MNVSRETAEQLQELKRTDQNQKLKLNELQEEMVAGHVRHAQRFASIASRMHETFLVALPEQPSDNSPFQEAVKAFHEQCQTAAKSAGEPIAVSAPGHQVVQTPVGDEETAASKSPQLRAKDEMPAPAARNQAPEIPHIKSLIQGWRRRELFNERERSRMSVAVGQTVDLLLALHAYDPAAATDALWALQDAEKQTIHELELVEKSATDPSAADCNFEQLPEWLQTLLAKAGLAEAFQCNTADKSLYCCQSVMEGIPDAVQDEWLASFKAPSREQAHEKLKLLVASAASTGPHSSAEPGEATQADGTETAAKRRRMGADSAAGSDAEDAPQDD